MENNVINSMEAFARAQGFNSYAEYKHRICGYEYPKKENDTRILTASQSYSFNDMINAVHIC